MLFSSISYGYDDLYSKADAKEARFERKYSESPDDKLFRHLAKTYASLNPSINKVNASCPKRPEEIFPDGITNGADW